MSCLSTLSSGGREVAGSSPVIPTERKSKPLITSSLDFFYILNWRDFGVITIINVSLPPLKSILSNQFLGSYTLNGFSI